MPNLIPITSNEETLGADDTGEVTRDVSSAVMHAPQFKIRKAFSYHSLEGCSKKLSIEAITIIFGETYKNEGRT
jgi:hypothetical protein